MNREEEEFNVAIAISASLFDEKKCSPNPKTNFEFRQKNNQSKPYEKEQNITVETDPNSYHTTTYKIYNNRTHTPPPPYASCSPDPTATFETKNLEFSRNLEKLGMDTNSANNRVERIYPSLSAPSMIHQTNSPIHQTPIHQITIDQTPLNMPQLQETVVTLRNQNIVKPNPSILFQFLVCGKDINAS